MGHFTNVTVPERSSSDGDSGQGFGALKSQKTLKHLSTPTYRQPQVNQQAATATARVVHSFCVKAETKQHPQGPRQGSVEQQQCELGGFTQ
jgi:hypothetical protein